MNTKIYEIYSPEHDITFIMEDVIGEYQPHENGLMYAEVISTEVKGFYCGTPSEELTKAYYGKLKAEYTE